MNAPQSIRFGIIGAVGRGSSFVKALQSHPNAEIVALCDIQEELLARPAAELGVPLTFTEMFCPDWSGNTVFMSHMGECNVALAPGPVRLVEKDYRFGETENPAVAVFAVRPGPATLVNLAPGPEEVFDLVASRVRVLDYGTVPGFPDVPHFWVRPEDSDLKSFLRGYSQCGGTHHSALVMGDQVDAMARMAQMLGLNFERV